MSDLYDTLEGLKEELQDWIKENPGDDPSDYIFELADSGVPIYTSDILKFAQENISLATEEPEVGPAFDGSNTPINLIASNIFEYLNDELYEYYQEHENDYLEDDDEELEEV